MPVRITILSGSRQGEILETDQQLVAVGDLPTDDVVFDALRDTEIRDRRATLKLDGDRWCIHNAGSKPIFVNHDVVTTSHVLRSGDIVRMSHDGPDFTFDLISSLSKSKTPAAEISEAGDTAATSNDAATPLRALEPEPPGDSVRQTAWPFDWRVMMAGSLVLIAMLSAWAFWPNQKPRLDPPRLGSFPVLDFNEGEHILWKPPLVSSTPNEESLRYKFVGDVPKGMTIDAITGAIKWQTTEDHGPQQYRCSIMVFDDQVGESVSDTETLEIQIKEVNQSPVPARLTTQRVNLRDGNELRVQLRADDPDAPSQKLSFHLTPEAPDGVSLDPDTGQLVWIVGSEFANQAVTIPYRVTDDATDPRSADGVVRVRVDLPDPWAIVENKLRDCVYLLVAQTNPGQSILPLGTACAIEPHTLLTSATVATGANDAVRRGWKILAVNTENFRLEDVQGNEVTKIRSHAGYVHATDPVEQAFFDLALLTSSEPLPAQCKLGDVEASASNGQELGCFGFEIHPGSLTRFDSPRPILAKAKLLEVMPPPNQTAIPGRQPYLLQLIGGLPFQPFGGLIINDDAEVLGIYAFRGELPENAPPTPIHYAPDVVLASAFLAGQGESLWVAPEEPPAQDKDNPK